MIGGVGKREGQKDGIRKGRDLGEDERDHFALSKKKSSRKPGPIRTQRAGRGEQEARDLTPKERSRGNGGKERKPETFAKERKKKI